jgi:uncharacterized protein (DUF983 family)
MALPSFFRDLGAGFSGRCPACGEGKMFRAFLKVADACARCGEELHHHRADDFPAYIVVSIVGHIMLSMAFWIETTFKPELWVPAVTLLPFGGLLTLLLIQPVKGAIVAVQWRIGMDGFAASKAARAGR